LTSAALNPRELAVTAGFSRATKIPNPFFIIALSHFFRSIMQGAMASCHLFGTLGSMQTAAT
jgi:hypothetical protein